MVLSEFQNNRRVFQIKLAFGATLLFQASHNYTQTKTYGLFFLIPKSKFVFFAKKTDRSEKKKTANLQLANLTIQKVEIQESLLSATDYGSITFLHASYWRLITDMPYLGHVTWRLQENLFDLVDFYPMT